MSRNRTCGVATVLIVLALVLGACAQAPATQVPPTQAPPTQAPAGQEPTAAPAANVPTTCNICSLHGAGIDQSWSASWFDAWKNVAAEHPHGLTITYDSYTENSWGDDALRTIQNYAESGKCDIIWGHTSYSDQVKQVNQQYPNTMFVVSGSGNEGLGGNVYWIYEHGHEAAYLAGIVAGSMTKSDVIGFVGGFPADDVNDVLNGFIDGAKSVNPKVQLKYTFIESWYDPAKAKEAALAQIAAGADFIYCERQGAEAACAEKGVYAVGHFVDQDSLAPGTFITSTIINWQPSVEYIVEQWWEHKTSGTPFDASTEPVWWGMKDGGADIAPYHELDSVVPQSVKDAVAEAKQEIMDGSLVVPLKVDLPQQ